MNTDESKRRRRGPAPLDATDKRGHTVSVRLNDAELARLDSQRDAVQMQRGAYPRAAALHRLGCQQAQGYLYARPLPADELQTLLQDWPAAHWAQDGATE